jgi:hypothetical protein
MAVRTRPCQPRAGLTTGFDATPHFAAVGLRERVGDPEDGGQRHCGGEATGATRGLAAAARGTGARGSRTIGSTRCNIFGQQNRTVVPEPGALATCTTPPIRSQTARTAPIPMPRPENSETRRLVVNPS